MRVCKEPSVVISVPEFNELMRSFELSPSPVLDLTEDEERDAWEGMDDCLNQYEIADFLEPEELDQLTAPANEDVSESPPPPPSPMASSEQSPERQKLKRHYDSSKMDEREDHPRTKICRRIDIRRKSARVSNAAATSKQCDKRELKTKKMYEGEDHPRRKIPRKSEGVSDAAGGTSKQCDSLELKPKKESTPQHTSSFHMTLRNTSRRRCRDYYKTLNSQGCCPLICQTCRNSLADFVSSKLSSLNLKNQ